MFISRIVSYRFNVFCFQTTLLCVIIKSLCQEEEIQMQSLCLLQYRADPYPHWDERLGVVGTERFQALQLSSCQNQNRKKAHTIKLRWPVTYACARSSSSSSSRQTSEYGISQCQRTNQESNNLLTLLSLDYENKERGRNSKLSTLMVYGDSIGLHYYRLATNRPLCKEIFRTCSKKYMWTYDVSCKI